MPWEISGLETRLIAFSDDMDGLRKVPLNLPQPEMLAQHLGKPLHAIPDPFGQHDSFSGYMNDKLKTFLDTYRFDYNFQSSAEAYKRGDFDEGLSILLDRVHDVRADRPDVGRTNALSGHRSFPVPRLRFCIHTRVTDYFPERQSIGFACDGSVGRAGLWSNERSLVLGGHVKVGWKVDGPFAGLRAAWTTRCTVKT